MDYSDSPVGMRNDSKSGLERELTELSKRYNILHEDFCRERDQHQELKELVREIANDGYIDWEKWLKLKQKVQPDPAK